MQIKMKPFGLITIEKFNYYFQLQKGQQKENNENCTMRKQMCFPFKLLVVQFYMQLCINSTTDVITENRLLLQFVLDK